MVGSIGGVGVGGGHGGCCWLLGVGVVGCWQQKYVGGVGVHPPRDHPGQVVVFLLAPPTNQPPTAMATTSPKRKRSAQEILDNAKSQGNVAAAMIQKIIDDNELDISTKLKCMRKSTYKDSLKGIVMCQIMQLQLQTTPTARQDRRQRRQLSKETKPETIEELREKWLQQKRTQGVDIVFGMTADEMLSGSREWETWLTMNE